MSIDTPVSAHEYAEIESKLLNQLRRRGVATHEKIHIKIIGNFPIDGRFSYEVTFDGDRRASVESFETIEEAQHASVIAAMLGPKAPEEAETAPTKQVVVQAMREQGIDPHDRRRWDITEVASHYKARGYTAHEGWNRYIIETGLQPQFDFKNLLKAWNPPARNTRARKR